MTIQNYLFPQQHQEPTLSEPVKPQISVVVPIYNEVESLPKLIESITESLNSTGLSYEMIYVDDGSTDGSLERLEKIKLNNEYGFTFKIIKLDINSGKGKAIQTGIKNSIGEYILLQDADLELDTKDAFEMFEMIQSNNEIKCIFGSRYLSGKLKRNNFFFNNLIGKLNSLIFVLTLITL